MAPSMISDIESTDNNKTVKMNNNLIMGGVQSRNRRRNVNEFDFDI